MKQWWLVQGKGKTSRGEGSKLWDVPLEPASQSTQSISHSGCWSTGRRRELRAPHVRREHEQLSFQRGRLRNFRAAYDILVRPQDSFTPLEKQQGLIQQNYLSGVFGGIRFQQCREIKDIPGVEVAAHIANIRYVIA